MCRELFDVGFVDSGHMIINVTATSREATPRIKITVCKYQDQSGDRSGKYPEMNFRRSLPAFEVISFSTTIFCIFIEISHLSQSLSLNFCLRCEVNSPKNNDTSNNTQLTMRTIFSNISRSFPSETIEPKALNANNTTAIWISKLPNCCPS